MKQYSQWIISGFVLILILLYLYKHHENITNDIDHTESLIKIEKEKNQILCEGMKYKETLKMISKLLKKSCPSDSFLKICSEEIKKFHLNEMEIKMKKLNNDTIEIYELHIKGYALNEFEIIEYIHIIGKKFLIQIKKLSMKKDVSRITVEIILYILRTKDGI